MNAKTAGENIGPGYEGVGEFYNLFASNDDIPFFLDYARRQGSPVLDVAAGAGRLTLPLAREGFEVTALEISPSMLKEFRKRLSREPHDIAARICLVEGDMRNFSLDQAYSLIIIPDSFGHAMTSRDQLSTLACIRKHLANRGLFILDFRCGALLPDHVEFEEPPASLPDGRVVTRRGEIHTDFVNQIMRVDLKYSVHKPHWAGRDHGRVIEVVSGAAVIYNREADLLVGMSGFVVEQEFGGFDSRPYTSECERRVLLLRGR
jgi:SAM-dependent methyltransferase